MLEHELLDHCVLHLHQKAHQHILSFYTSRPILLPQKTTTGVLIGQI